MENDEHVGGRPAKNTVDYFPHDCTHKKTLFIVEQKYGNDGYAFWFKLLEVLGDTPGHCVDLNENGTSEYLQAKTRLEPERMEDILNLLAKLDAIDKDLWENRKIWSEGFIERLSFVYAKRNHDLPGKPILDCAKNTPKEGFPNRKPTDSEVSGNGKTQSKVKESKLNNISKGEPEEKTSVPFKKIQDLYNSICVKKDSDMPKCTSITESSEREKHVRALWKLHPDLSYFENLFKLAYKSDFLTGRNKDTRPDDKWKDWNAKFDFILNKNNAIKIIEGEYKTSGTGAKIKIDPIIQAQMMKNNEKNTGGNRYG